MPSGMSDPAECRQGNGFLSASDLPDGRMRTCPRDRDGTRNRDFPPRTAAITRFRTRCVNRISPLREVGVGAAGIAQDLCRVEADWDDALTGAFRQKPYAATLSMLNVARCFASFLGGVWGSCGVSGGPLSTTSLRFSYETTRRQRHTGPTRGVAVSARRRTWQAPNGRKNARVAATVPRRTARTIVPLALVQLREYSPVTGGSARGSDLRVMSRIERATRGTPDNG